MNKVIRIVVIFLVFFLPSLSSHLCFAYEPQEFYGDQLIVTATKYPKHQIEIASSTTIITRKDIEASSAKNVSDILRGVSGVDIKTNGYLGSTSSIQLRGANSSQTLILIDGVRINSPSLGSADLGDILLADIERIEIVKDPISSLYGADAIGGVINIITRDVSKKSKTIIDAAYGSFSTQNYTISNSGKIGNLGYYLSATELKSNGFRQNSDYNSQNYYLKIGGEPLSFKLFKYKDNKGTPGVPTSETDKYSASLPFDRQADDNTYMDLSFTNRLSDNLKTHGKIYQNQIQMYNHYADWFVPGLFYDDNYLSFIRGFELNGKAYIGSNLTTDIGGELREDESTGPWTGTHLIHNYAVYLQGDYRTNENLMINLSARADKNSSHPIQISPKAGIVYHCSADTTLKATFANAFRAPTMNELYWNQPSFGTFGNPALQPEKSTGVTIGIDKQLRSNANASLSWYKNNVSGLIQWSQTGPAAWSPINIGTVNIEGVDFELKKDIGEWLGAYANYSYQKVTDTANGKYIIYSPQNKYNIGVRYATDSQFISNLTLNYVGSRFTDSLNTSTLPPYMVVNLKISKRTGIFNIALNCENLFNEDYSESVGTAANDFATRGYPMPGRRLSLGLTLI